MLNVMRRIIQEVNAAHNLSEAMQIMVTRVREAMHTEACTVFLVDERSKQYVMMATDGLNPAAVKKVRVNYDEGLIGLVGKREEPINLVDAPSHPNFLFHPALGEERLHSFLGVPIIHQRRLLGVLTVHQQEERRFDEAEEAFLVTMSAQLAGEIAIAQATGGLAELSLESFILRDEVALGGIPSVPGVGIGIGVVIYPPADLEAVPDRKIENIDEEVAIFETALASARLDIAEMAKRLPASLPRAERQLFDVYLEILDGSNLGNEVITEIRKGQWAEGALRHVIKQHARQFSEMEDVYLRERAVDIRDLGRRVLSQLQTSHHTVKVYPDKTILVGDEVTAASLAEVPYENLVGVISKSGSSNSHVAILARAMGIPTVMGAQGLPVIQLEGKQLIVDGYYGQVFVEPSSKLLNEYTLLAEEEKELQENLEQLRGVPAQTLDGHEIALYVNIGLALDAGLSFSIDADGIGLFRTEMPFMMRDCFPTEEEQRVIYRQLLKAFAPRPVTMRTLDIGGDKNLPYFTIEEDNPFLGWRGIRVTLDHPEVFLVQIRAMLRASSGLNNLQIMLPLVTNVAEVDEANSLIKQAYMELLEEGEQIQMPEIGVMIEVPSAVYLADAIASRVDFLSIGSNDLTQYILAVDRNNSRVAGLYDSLHPAVLQALQQVVKGGHKHGKKVSLCGEMAGDPAAVILLLAMGLDSLSMNATSLLRSKWVIRSFAKQDAARILKKVCAMEDPVLVRFELEKALDEAGLGGLIRAGKK